MNRRLRGLSTKLMSRSAIETAPHFLANSGRKTFTWEGSVLLEPDRHVTPLVPGLYWVRGTAGFTSLSAPVWIRVE